ncbi:Vps54-domain-containing protein [Lichtheimia hyalospora FSU 10163]|nr:Vps54-domain-containing protein [Lichtheimia hyalospora FSU 10163]
MSDTDLPWTTADIGFNAISGVLNDPANRTPTFTRPSKSDVPPAPHVSIPKPKLSDFNEYLHEIEPLFEQYQHNQREKQEHEKMTPDTTALTTLDVPERSGRNPYGQVLSSESLLMDESDSSASHHIEQLVPLDTVPDVFFDPEFTLENPRTFDKVYEGSDITGNLSLLQEKLPYYLDTVEQHLVREIDKRSDSFFEASSNLQALHQETLECVDQIRSLRGMMQSIQKSACDDGLQVTRLQIRQRNLEHLYTSIQGVKDIIESQHKIQTLVSQGNYFEALDLINQTRMKKQHIKGNIHALGSISSQLEEMESTIGNTMQQDFLSILLSDISYHQETGEATISLVEPLSEKIELEADMDLRQSLEPSVKGLLRTDTLKSTLDDYQQYLLREIKAIVRRQYPTTNEDDSAVARQLRTMPLDAFFRMLVHVMTALLKVIQRVMVHQHTLISLMPDDNKRLAMDIVYTAADSAHAQCAKLLSFRSEQNARLNPHDFYRLLAVSRGFIQQSDNLCLGRACLGLRGTLLSQQKAFVEHFHMERMKQQLQLIDNEQWMVIQVPADFQDIVDRICSNTPIKDDASCPTMVNATMDENTDSKKNSNKRLIVNGKSYFVVGCSLLMIKLLEDYMKCSTNLENMATDVMQKLIELLKLFNSQICQAILGAGAMRTAGLKNISAKHLALASQSISIMTALIPSLKHGVERYLPPKHTVLLTEFDRTITDYDEHRREIYAKLVSIMQERLMYHIQAMYNMNWDAEHDDTDDQNVNAYMEILVKETLTLHKVLNKYLSHSELQEIMVDIFTLFNKQLSQDIKKLSIHSESGKHRLSKDVAYFIRRLSSLPGIDPPPNDILDVVDNIPVTQTS